jgi:hypothetical protein
MRGVLAALPLSIVVGLILSSMASACSESDRPGDMCGRAERGSPGFRWDKPGREKGEGEKLIREKIEREKAEREDFESKRREIENWAEKEAWKADAKMQEAIALQRNTETLQEYLSTKIADEKNLTEAAIKREHEAADKIKEADEAKRAADDQLKLFKADRERQEKRLVELLAHDPCGAQAAQGGASGTAGGAGTR